MEEGTAVCRTSKLRQEEQNSIQNNDNFINFLNPQIRVKACK